MIHNLLDRMKLPFRKNKEFLSVLYDILGFYPHDVEIYRLAFSHKSLSYHADANSGKDRRGGRRDKRPRSENTTKPLNNERLEYLGDAVLETVVSDILFRHFEHKREGFLTSTRSKIVQRESLNRLAEQMGLEALIQAAQGTRMSHTNIGGNAFEALMGAIYLDRGFKYCHWFITHRVVGAYIDLDTVAQKEVNFKSKLLEWCQKNRINTDFRDSGGNDGERGFRSSIVLEGITVGKGSGRSKKESQQVAAKDALSRMRREQKLYDSIFRAKEKRTAMEADESFALPKIDEPDDIVIKGRDKDKPVLEDENGRRRNFAAGADDYHDSSDAAYDEAYGDNPKYEVIDDPENESEYSDYATSIQPDDEEDVQPTPAKVGSAPKKEKVSANKDKASANKDKAKPAQAKAESDEPARTPQTKAERKRERNRTAKTIDDAVKGSKKVKADAPVPAEPKPETANAEVATESANANATEDKPLSESAKRRQRRKARREAMASDETNPFEELDNERQDITANEAAPVDADEAQPSSTDADNAPAAETDDELETVELHIAPEADDAQQPVEAELSTVQAEEEPVAEAEAEAEEVSASYVREETTELAAEEESASTTSEEPISSEAEEPHAPAEAEPIEADADDIEDEEENAADNNESLDATTEAVADNSEEDVAEEPEKELFEEPEDEEVINEGDDAADEDEATAEPYDINHSASRPHLRHISLDDFVFGATDATLYDRDEEAAPSEEADSTEGSNRRQRNSRSRRRKPSAAKKAADQAPEAEGESTKDTAKAQQRKAPKAPKNAEPKKGASKPKKVATEDEGEAKVRADREKAAKRRAQQRRRRRRESSKGDNPSAED